jgi:hypothetical protein
MLDVHDDSTPFIDSGDYNLSVKKNWPCTVLSIRPFFLQRQINPGRVSGLFFTSTHDTAQHV